MAKKYICEECGKEFSDKEQKPIYSKTDKEIMGVERPAFCSRGCLADYEHAKKKDW